jgi:tetratricopeptide (TPR) repeat protein
MVLAAFVLNGCMSVAVNKNKSANNTGSIPPIYSYQQKAMDFEKKDEWQSALENWRIADALMTQKISALTEKIGNNAEMHYQKGLNLQREGLQDKATIEFLTTLRYDRNHKGALRCLRAIETPYRNIVYAVREGDSFQSIAGQLYKNLNDDYIIKYFSGLSSEKELTPGLVLTLPNLDPEFTIRFFNYSKEISIARKFYKEKDYHRLIPSAENILIHMPESEEAVFMINMSYIGLSEQFLTNEDYSAAIDMLKRVDPKFRNVKSRIANIEKIQAKHRYDAIEKINKDNYRLGKSLYAKGQYLKALAVLEKIEPDYLYVKKVISDLKVEMKKESEIHYRKGVKHYLKEELKEAVSEWQQAQALDPDNFKIKKDIDNATQLIKKIENIK